MSIFTSTIFNAILMALIVGAIVGLLVWSVVTQYRDPGCESVRLRWRRPGIRVPELPEFAPPVEETAAVQTAAAEPAPEELVLI